MSYIAPIVPENAPFTAAQRAWLNGWLAAYMAFDAAAAAQTPASAPAPTVEASEDFPWHDPSVALDERLRLAEGRPRERLLMAAMAQLDCGQCGYLCQTYSEALASGAETSTSLCVPGAKATQKALKAMLAEAPVVAATPASAAVVKPKGVPVPVLAATRLTGAGSEKDVRHVVIDLAGSGLRYEPGDSLSLVCPN